MASIIKYLCKHINKKTIIESKNIGKIIGTITKIDKNFNLTIIEAKVEGKLVQKITVRGSDLRTFELK